MEDKSHSINHTDNSSREPDTSNTAANAAGSAQEGTEGKEDTGITPGQLNNIQRSATSRSAASGTKPFLTGTDSDGQL